MTRLEMMAAKMMNPAMTHRAVLRPGSSPCVPVAMWTWRGCVGVSMIFYMTQKWRKGYTTGIEIPDRIVGRTLRSYRCETAAFHREIAGSETLLAHEYIVSRIK
jgi:hypothetical protein